MIIPLFFLIFSLDSILIKTRTTESLDSLIYSYTESASPYTKDYTEALFIRDILASTDSMQKSIIRKQILENYTGNCTFYSSEDDRINVLSVLCNLKKGQIKKAEHVFQHIKEKPYLCWAAFFIGKYMEKSDNKKAIDFYKKSIFTCPNGAVAIFARDRFLKLQNKHG